MRVSSQLQETLHVGKLLNQALSGRHLHPINSSFAQLFIQLRTDLPYDSLISMADAVKEAIAHFSLHSIVFVGDDVMSGGALPSSLKPKVPAVVAAAADPLYKDYRSYYNYICLPIGSYSCLMYDSYGDGWNGGSLTITQMVNATAGCQLLSGAPERFNKTLPFAITVRWHGSTSGCFAPLMGLFCSFKACRSGWLLN
jgi:hypothetical protein